MKVAVIPNRDLINYSNAEAIIVGLKDFSINFYQISIEEIEKFLNESSQELFVAVNKNIHNNELADLEKVLMNLSKLNIKGILYADVAVLEINNNLNLNLNLIWSQEHLTTNLHTINYWCSKGANGSFISNDITKREILEIKEGTNCLLMTQVFGYIPIYASRRHAVKNYLNNFSLSSNSEINYIESEEKDYPIVDNKMGTQVYSSDILYALKETLEYRKHNFDYIILNFFNILDYQKEIIDIFKTVTDENIEEYDSFIKSKFKNLSSLFLYLETIYKVK